MLQHGPRFACRENRGILVAISQGLHLFVSSSQLAQVMEFPMQCTVAFGVMLLRVSAMRQRDLGVGVAPVCKKTAAPIRDLLCAPQATENIVHVL